MERIVNTELGVIREPLRAPFGFKGGTLSELWQTAVRLTLDSGASGMGVGVQSVLWSDPVTFCACDEAGGNERMLAVTRRALELLQGQAFTDPDYSRCLTALLALPNTTDSVGFCRYSCVKSSTLPHKTPLTTSFFSLSCLFYE